VQYCVAPHVFPHVPQSSGSVWMSTQLAVAPAPHTVPPGPQEQTPSRQTSPSAHAVVHVPQWLGSVIGSVHAPVHSTLPAGQLHALALQTSPEGHAPVQEPQWFGSLVGSTQPTTTPHSRSPAGQPQTPSVHVEPGSHALPHAPQFFGSVVATMHPMTGPQSLRPAGHPHAPAVQTAPSSHAVVQSPQCAGSVVTSVQLVPHICFGAAHPASAGATSVLESAGAASVAASAMVASLPASSVPPASCPASSFEPLSCVPPSWPVLESAFESVRASGCGMEASGFFAVPSATASGPASVGVLDPPEQPQYRASDTAMSRLREKVMVPPP
jgi:hypothetical protein